MRSAPDLDLTGIVGIVRRLPFTIVFWLVVLAVGLATGSLWSTAETKSWYPEVAFGVPSLRDGAWWTVATSIFVEPSPGIYLVALLVVAIGLGWAEWQLGTVQLLLVAVGGTVIAELGSAGLVALFATDATSWRWAEELADTRSTGAITVVVAALAAGSATLRSPWRLRLRVSLGAVVAIVFLFEGTLSTVQYVIAFLVMIPVGERWLSTDEHGLWPRTRREVRMLGCAGVLVIAGANLAVFFFPASGPLGPTDAGEDSVFSMLIGVAINVAIADQLRRGKRWAWWVVVVFGLLNVVATIVVLALIAFSGLQSEGAVTLGTSLLWALVLAILIPGRFAFRVPWRVARIGDGGEDPVETVKDLIRRHGGGTMSWMITWPGNEYVFGTGGESVVACQKHVGTLLALADPVCPPEQLTDAVGSFVDVAEHSGLTPCWFSIGADTARTAESMGWRSVQIAEDTILDLADLEFKGKRWQHVRSAINKSKKQAISLRMVTLADEPFAIRSQVRAISEEWVGDKGLPEMGFTLGTVDEALDPAVKVALAVDEVGDVHGVLSWLPVYGPDGEVRGWTLDVMRRRTDGFGPVIEFLIASSAVEFKEQGAQFVSLSGAPLARADDGSGVEVDQMDKVLDSLGAALEPFYGFRSLHTFKKKFNPRYEPVFLAFRDEADLPRIGVAISRAYLPDATPAQLVRLARSSH